MVNKKELFSASRRVHRECLASRVSNLESVWTQELVEWRAYLGWLSVVPRECSDSSRLDGE